MKLGIIDPNSKILTYIHQWGLHDWFHFMLISMIILSFIQLYFFPALQVANFNQFTMRLISNRLSFNIPISMIYNHTLTFQLKMGENVTMNLNTFM